MYPTGFLTSTSSVPIQKLLGEMDELNAGLAAAQGAADACAATVDELCEAAKQSVGDLRAANDRLRHKLAETEEELVRTRAALLEAHDQLAKARAVEVATRAMRNSGELVGYIRGGAAEESPLRSNSPMTITQLPSWGDDDGQLALGKPKRDVEASQGEASFRPAVCEACNVAMVTKQGMEDHLGGRKHRKAMERLRREQGTP